MVEAYCDMPHTMQYYGTKKYPIVHFPFNFGFTGMKSFPNARKLDELINDWLKNMPPGGVANWVVSITFPIIEIQIIQAHYTRPNCSQDHEKFHIHADSTYLFLSTSCTSHVPF